MVLGPASTDIRYGNVAHCLGRFGKRQRMRCDKGVNSDRRGPCIFLLHGETGFASFSTLEAPGHFLIAKRDRQLERTSSSMRPRDLVSHRTELTNV